MSKEPNVTFKKQRITEGDWQIVAEGSGTEPKYVMGFKSKVDVDKWLTEASAQSG